MTIKEIGTVCCIGAGNMGCFNAIKAAISGYDVVVYDIDEEHLQQASQHFQGLAAFLVESAYCAE